MWNSYLGYWERSIALVTCVLDNTNYVTLAKFSHYQPINYKSMNHKRMIGVYLIHLAYSGFKRRQNLYNYICMYTLYYTKEK